MLDYGFWSDAEISAARAGIIAAASGFEACEVGDPALERAAILFNEVVDQVRTRLGHDRAEADDEDKLNEEERTMVRARYMEEVQTPPPQTAEVIKARTKLLQAVRDLDKPLGKWERELALNVSCMRYAAACMAARRARKESERSWQGTKAMPTMSMENSCLNADG